MPHPLLAPTIEEQLYPRRNRGFVAPSPELLEPPSPYGAPKVYSGQIPPESYQPPIPQQVDLGFNPIGEQLYGQAPVLEQAPQPNPVDERMAQLDEQAARQAEIKAMKEETDEIRTRTALEKAKRDERDLQDPVKRIQAAGRAKQEQGEQDIERRFRRFDPRGQEFVSRERVAALENPPTPARPATPARIPEAPRPNPEAELYNQLITSGMPAEQAAEQVRATFAPAVKPAATTRTPQVTTPALIEKYLSPEQIEALLTVKSQPKAISKRETISLIDSLTKTAYGIPTQTPDLQAIPGAAEDRDGLLSLAESLAAELKGEQPSPQDVTPAGTEAEAVRSRATLLAEYKRLGGSKTPAGRKFADDNLGQ